MSAPVPAPEPTPAAAASPSAPPARVSEGPSAGARDMSTALRNGLKLGSSLLATWSVALFMRLLLPRYLGPERFGELNFADSFAGTYFVFLGLGLETWISKELPVKPQRANEFFGGAMILRVGLSAVLIAALAVTILATHRSDEIRNMVLVFAVAQLLVSINGTLAGMLQAQTNVGGLAIMNVTSKALWGVGIVAGLLLHWPLVMLAAAMVVSELVKAIVLFRIAKKAYSLEMRVDMAALKLIVVASIPYYINTIVVTLNSKLDVTLLEFLTGDHAQVGWYSAAQNIAGLTMMVSPVLLWVVMPLMSRAAARSKDELWSIIRRSIEGIYLVTLPAILMVWLSADFIVQTIFGVAFAPAAMVLRAIAPILMLTYLAMLLSMTLVVLERSWMLTTVSSIGLFVNVALTLLFVPLFNKLLPIGGAAVGDALGVVGMELIVSTMLVWALGRQAIDRRILMNVAKSVVVCVGVVGLHMVMRPIGNARLLLDGVAYVVLALIMRVPSLGEIMRLVNMVRSRKQATPDPAAA